MDLPKFESTEQLALFLKSLPRHLTEEEVDQISAEHENQLTPTERLGIRTGSSMTLYRLDVQVGSKWIPAIKDPVSEKRAEQLKSAYAVARPQAKTRVVPVENHQPSISTPRKKRRK